MIHEPLSVVTNAKCWWAEQKLSTLELQQLYLAPVIQPGKWGASRTAATIGPPTSNFKPEILHLILPPFTSSLSFNTFVLQAVVYWDVGVLS